VLFVAAGDAAPRPLLLVASLPNTAVVVTRAERASLDRIGRPILLGEYHDSWALSPNGALIAFGISAPGRSARIGVRLVDLRRWKVVANFETGIAADVLWWATARRLIAVLPACICHRQVTGFVVVDPATRKIVRRVRFRGTLELFHGGQAITSRLAVLLDDRVVSTPAPGALALIGADGSHRVVRLARIRLSPERWGTAAVARSGRGFVVVSDGIAAEVDPTTLAVTYHALDAAPPASRFVAAAGLGDAVAVAWSDTNRRTGRLDLISTRTWQVRDLEDASAMAVTGGVILAYGTGAKGIRGYRADGSRAFSILGGDVVRSVAVTKSVAYVQTASATVAVDAASGTIVRRVSPPQAIRQAIDPG
jgi:hypothetical protein